MYPGGDVGGFRHDGEMSFNFPCPNVTYNYYVHHSHVQITGGLVLVDFADDGSEVAYHCYVIQVDQDSQSHGNQQWVEALLWQTFHNIQCWLSYIWRVPVQPICGIPLVLRPLWFVSPLSREDENYFIVLL